MILEIIGVGAIIGMIVAIKKLRDEANNLQLIIDSEREHHKNDVIEQRADAIMRSKSVMKGQGAEQIAPFREDFPYNYNDCRFLGSPIDLIVFDGNSINNVSKVVFVEIKTGKSQLSKRQRQIKKAVENGSVEWLEYRL